METGGAVERRGAARVPSELLRPRCAAGRGRFRTAAGSARAGAGRDTQSLSWMILRLAVHRLKAGTGYRQGLKMQQLRGETGVEEVARADVNEQEVSEESLSDCRTQGTQTNNENTLLKAVVEVPLQSESVEQRPKEGIRDGEVEYRKKDNITNDYSSGDSLIDVKTDIQPEKKTVISVSETNEQNEQQLSGDHKPVVDLSMQKVEETKGCSRMTKKALRDICKQQKLYLTPSLNDTLYLHYKGFDRLENLEEYTGLKCLWLECNGLTKIENLEAQAELRCLYLQLNLITCLRVLHTLQIAHNRLQTVEDIQHLQECPSVCVLDLSHNKLDDPQIIDVLETMPDLRVLNLMGNEVRKKISNYRKTLTVRLKQLTYLDDRPVFPKDRACAEAWAKGGNKAEKEEREKWENRERRKIQDSIDALAAIRQKAEERKRQREREQSVAHEKCENINIKSLEGNFLPSGDRIATDSTSGISNPSEEAETQRKIEKFVNESMEVHDEFTSAISNCEYQSNISNCKIVIKVQEDERESDAHKCPNFTTKGEEVLPGKMATESALVTELNESADVEQIKLEIPEKFYIDELPDLEDVGASEFSQEEEISTRKQTYHPKIEIISEVTNDEESLSEEYGKTTFENLVTEEIPTAIFSNIYKVPEDSQKKTLSPLVEALLAEPLNTETNLETKNNQARPPKPLVLEIIPENECDMPVSSACNKVDNGNDPVPWEEDSGDNHIAPFCSGTSADDKTDPCLAENGTIAHKPQDGNKQIEYGLD
ncbi:dynein axonemal assembly factor 1 isoform X3 [Alligator mississippiensis]|uniref:dynein axonemal assembly factor 1 isoform X3 n=1 Tax=Alligator mississippiensis TaxID=8496 RepID=UPI0009070638|nr:dynein axonemal assembly factor 1 isoform X3 [Alligator mississippiensis]